MSTIGRLFLMDTPVTDAGLKELHGLKALRLINVSRTKVTDEGVSELQKALPDLKRSCADRRRGRPLPRSLRGQLTPADRAGKLNPCLPAGRPDRFRLPCRVPP
jgi:hypothetical protein